MRFAAVALLLFAGGCADRSRLPADETKTFDPIVFFAGHSRGTATLNKLVGDDVAVRVDSVGKADGRGGLILDQAIREGNKSPRRRRWEMVRHRAGHFTGSLTDAQGPVAIQVDGPRASISYEMKNGMSVDQQLALQRDGRTLLNRLTVGRFGIRLATLDETIRKLD